VKSNSEKSWRDDFAEFVAAGSEPQASAALAARVRRRLFPNPVTVFAKVLALHAVFGFFSLAVCHQFGLNPFGTDRSLADWFMNVGGENFCMIACGVVFIGLTYIVAALFLSLEEFEAVRRHEWLQTALIGLGSLAAFYFFGAKLVTAVALLWAAGALIGGLASIELTYRWQRARA
jgi:hypothetical protein